MVSDWSHDKKGSAYRIVLIGMLAVLIAITGYEGMAQAAKLQQKTFKSPDAAVKALMDATRANDVKALEALFGPDSKDLISSGDDVDDTRGREMFVKAYDDAHRVEKAGDNKRILYVGKDDWPMPVPIVKTGKRWHFQTEEGRQEILSRRIGKNEIGAIQTCLAIVDAEKEYATLDRDNDQLLEYAQKFESEKGKKDGLYWEAAPGEPLSPLGPLVARATAEGYGKAEQMSPYHGYLFQDHHGPGGECQGGRLQLHCEREHDRRIRHRGLSGPVPGLRRQDLHREPRGCRLREGPRAGDGAARGGHYAPSIRTSPGRRWKRSRGRVWQPALERLTSEVAAVDTIRERTWRRYGRDGAPSPRCKRGVPRDAMARNMQLSGKGLTNIAAEGNRGRHACRQLLQVTVIALMVFVGGRRKSTSMFKKNIGICR